MATTSTQKIEVKERVITAKELARALATILSFKRQDKKEGIEAKVTNKAVAESQLHIIENSNVWQQHKKTHPNAHLSIIDTTEIRNPESIRQRLGQEIVPYAPPTDKAATYAESPKPLHAYGGPHTAGPGGEYVGPGHPSSPGFMAGCDCGMVMKVEGNQQNQLQVTSYGIVGAKPSGIAYEQRAATDVYAQSNTQQATYSSANKSEYQ